MERITPQSLKALISNNQSDFCNKSFEGDFSGMILERLTIIDSDIREANLKNVIFYNSKIARLSFRGKDLREINFIKTVILEVDLCNANLKKAIFENSIIKWTKINNSSLKESCFIKNEFTGVSFCGSEIEGAIFKNNFSGEKIFSNLVPAFVLAEQSCA